MLALEEDTGPTRIAMSEKDGIGGWSFDDFFEWLWGAFPDEMMLQYGPLVGWYCFLDGRLWGSIKHQGHGTLSRYDEDELIIAGLQYSATLAFEYLIFRQTPTRHPNMFSILKGIRDAEAPEPNGSAETFWFGWFRDKWIEHFSANS